MGAYHVQSLIRTNLLEPSELELLSTVFRRCLGLVRLSGHKDRQDLAFALLEHYANGYLTEDELVARVLRDHANCLRGVA